MAFDFKGHLHADRVDGIMHAMGFKINCCEESKRAGILTVLLILSFTPCSSLLFLGSGRLSLSNEGQFLLLTKSSLTHLHAQLNQKEEEVWLMYLLHIPLLFSHYSSL